MSSLPNIVSDIASPVNDVNLTWVTNTYLNPKALNVVNLIIQDTPVPYRIEQLGITVTSSGRYEWARGSMKYYVTLNADSLEHLEHVKSIIEDIEHKPVSFLVPVKRFEVSQQVPLSELSINQRSMDVLKVLVQRHVPSANISSVKLVEGRWVVFESFHKFGDVTMLMSMTELVLLHKKIIPSTFAGYTLVANTTDPLLWLAIKRDAYTNAVWKNSVVDIDGVPMIHISDIDATFMDDSMSLYNDVLAMRREGVFSICLSHEVQELDILVTIAKNFGIEVLEEGRRSGEFHKCAYFKGYTADHWTLDQQWLEDTLQKHLLKDFTTVTVYNIIPQWMTLTPDVYLRLMYYANKAVSYSSVSGNINKQHCDVQVLPTGAVIIPADDIRDLERIVNQLKGEVPLAPFSYVKCQSLVESVTRRWNIQQVDTTHRYYSLNYFGVEYLCGNVDVIPNIDGNTQYGLIQHLKRLYSADCVQRANTVDEVVQGILSGSKCDMQFTRHHNCEYTLALRGF